MEKEKIKKVIIILLALIFVLILSEVIIRFISRSVEKIKVNIEDNKKDEEYQDTQEYIQEVYLEDCIDKSIKLLRSGDYEKLYELLNPTYKEYMEFNSIESFITYLKNYVKDTETVELDDYYMNYGKYVCTFSGRTAVGTSKYKVLIEKNINDTSEYNFNIIFDDINYIETYDTYRAIYVDNIKYSLLYKVSSKDYSDIIMSITNNTSKEVKISLSDILLIKSDKKRYYPKDYEETEHIIPAGESSRVKFRFDDTLSSTMLDKYIDFTAKINGNISSLDPIQIVIEEEYYE